MYIGLLHRASDEGLEGTDDRTWRQGIHALSYNNYLIPGGSNSDRRACTRCALLSSKIIAPP